MSRSGPLPGESAGTRAGVNITVGLPVVRTSVDHGTAFDIASLRRRTSSLVEALRQAQLAPASEDRLRSRGVARPPCSVWPLRRLLPDDNVERLSKASKALTCPRCRRPGGRAADTVASAWRDLRLVAMRRVVTCSRLNSYL
jgi:hypothetical protein